MMMQEILQLDKAKVLVIGDIMLDAYYEGDASRISPEAPVPVVKIERKRNILGGAGNVARNIAALGGSCTLLSMIGTDFYGDIIKKLLEEAGIAYHLIEDKNRPTTVKSRIFARNQQMIRYDEEVDTPICTKNIQILQEKLKELLKDFEVILLSDYGKGFLYKELIENIYQAAAELGIAKPKIFIDPKPQNKTFYNNAFLLTPNHKETEALAGMSIRNREDTRKAAHAVLEELNAENILVTLGAEGMAYFSKNERYAYHIKSSAKQVFDVTGAGDTVIAAMAACESIGLSKAAACNIATLAAGLVVEKVGSATVTQEELIQAAKITYIDSENW